MWPDRKSVEVSVYLSANVVSGPAIMNNPRSSQLHLAGRPPAAAGSHPTQPAFFTVEPHGLDAATRTASVVEGEALFLASLPVIDDVTAQVCRRHRLSAAESDDFRSDVRLHFIERDYDVLRRFEGRSSLPTYVNVIIQRLFLDYRNRHWGKWRPSAQARRLGPTAVLFERLVTRDGWRVEQAMEMLRLNHGVVVDAALDRFAATLTSRSGRHFVTEDEAQAVPSDGPWADVKVVRAEQDFLAKRVQTALDRARQALDPEDRLVLRMRFEDAVPVADIARALHLDQKRLYRRIERLLAGIGESLEAEGISRTEARSLFADGSVSWERAGTGESGPNSRSGAATERARTSWLPKR
jgi:RNA polymerase sigma factor for flagellar operon FliA